MKYNNVKELTENIDKETTNAKEFEQRLMEKYPSLFREDKDGKLRSPDCGIWCPKGWEELVDRLCESIVFRVKNNHILEPRKFFMLPLRIWVWNKIFFKIRKLIDPTSKLFKNGNIVKTSVVQVEEANHPWRTYITKKTFRKIERILVPLNKYNLRPIPEVKIGQIKEKFGTLRFYYDGGDEVIQGMVSFAEALSGNICEMTGEAGSLCKKGKGLSWYKTLSERKANEIGYTKVE